MENLTTLNGKLITNSQLTRIVDDADCKIGDDLFRKTKKKVMKELENSDLINIGLLDEIETRLLSDQPSYTTEIVKNRRIAELVAKGIEPWKAREMIVTELSEYTTKGVAGFKSNKSPVDYKNIALQAIKDKKAKYKVEHLKNLKMHDAASGLYEGATKGRKGMDFFKDLSQPINLKISKGYATNYNEFRGADEDRLTSINNETFNQN